MNKEDIKFLKNLQYEMLTQDTVGQANPRFWVIIDKIKHYGIDSDYGYDGVEILSDGGEIIATNLKELYEFLIDNDEIIVELLNENHLKIIKKPYMSEYNVYDLDGFMDIADEFDYDSLNITYYKEDYKIVENTLFLTLNECKKHISNNNYHYNQPSPYAMTAWRSPQISKLYAILENTNWEDMEV